MNPDHSYMMSQVEALLKMAEQLARFPVYGPVPKEVEKSVSDMEKFMEKYYETVSNLPERKTPLTPKEQQLMAQWSELGLKAAGLGAALHIAQETIKIRKTRNVGKNTKKSIQKRQRKFRGVGGDDKWKKL